MTTPQRHPQDGARQAGADAPEPVNRAERRAQRRGSTAKPTPGSPFRNDQVQRSQVMALPKYKGKRGNR